MKVNRFKWSLIAAWMALSPTLQAQSLVTNPGFNLNTASLLPKNIYIGDHAVIRDQLFQPEFEAAKLRPLQFQAFSYRHPETGQAISGSTILTLPNGHRVTAAEYYGELNRQEKYLNDLGYSLKGNAENLGIVEDTVLKNQLLLDQRELLLRNAPSFTPIPAIANLNSSALAHSIAPAASAITNNSLIGGGIHLHPELIGVIRPTPCTSTDEASRTNNWSHRVGDSRFNVNMAADTRLQGSCNRIRAHAQGNVDGAAFGRNFNLAYSRLAGESNRSGNQRIEFDIRITGANVYSFHQNYNNPSWGSQRQFGINREFNFYFPVGPINLAVNIGVQGQAGFSYGVGFQGLAVEGRITPNANSSLYAEGGVNAWIIEAGVGGQFMLVAIELPLNASARLAFESSQFFIHAKAQGNIVLRALDGRLYAYVRVPVPRWGIPPWTMKRFDVTLVRWSGISLTRTMFLLDQKVRLI